MTSKRHLIAALLTSVLAGLAGCATDTATDSSTLHGHSAHESSHMDADPAVHAQHLQDLLGLSDQQRADIQTVLEQDPTHEQLHGALHAILTPDQLAELQSLHEQHHGERTGHGDPAHE